MDIITFDYKGVSLRFDPGSEMGSLTAMWDAAGRPENKSPRDWAGLVQAKDFMAALAESLNVEILHIYQTTRGRDGGTWAHWQLGMEYARYLDPRMAIHWNECVVAYKTGTPVQVGASISGNLLGALREHGERGVALHRQLVENCDAVVCTAVEVDEHNHAFQTQIAPLIDAARRQLQKSKEGWFYLVLPDGDRPGIDTVYVKIGKAQDDGARLVDHRGLNSGMNYHIKVRALDFSRCEAEMRRRIPEGFRDWQDRGTLDHYHRMDREFFNQLVAFLRGLDGPLTVQAIKSWRMTGMYQR